MQSDASGAVVVVTVVASFEAKLATVFVSKHIGVIVIVLSEALGCRRASGSATMNAETLYMHCGEVASSSSSSSKDFKNCLSKGPTQPYLLITKNNSQNSTHPRNGYRHGQSSTAGCVVTQSTSLSISTNAAGGRRRSSRNSIRNNW